MTDSDLVAHALETCTDPVCPIHRPHTIAEELERAFATEVFLAGARGSRHGSSALAWFLAGTRATPHDVLEVESGQ